MCYQIASDIFRHVIIYKLTKSNLTYAAIVLSFVRSFHVLNLVFQ